MSTKFMADSGKIYNMNKNKFRERLKETLKYNSMSQVTLAKKIGMSQSVINNYCTGKREPTLDVLLLICKALDVSSDYLLGLED